jgi:hypothetical protein
LKQLDGGYSVSETEDEMTSAIDGILSRGSMVGADNVYSPNHKSPGAADLWEGEEFDGQRNQQFSGALMNELASQKSKFTKKLHIMEK